MPEHTGSHFAIYIPWRAGLSLRTAQRFQVLGVVLFNIQVFRDITLLGQLIPEDKNVTVLGKVGNYLQIVTVSHPGNLKFHRFLFLIKLMFG